MVGGAILVLSLMDGLLTGFEIESGKAREANPLMNAVLNAGGIYTFFGIKVLMTAFPLAIIVLHKEWTLAKYAAQVCLLSYLLLAFYHLYLLQL
jgi:hypothetical protein